MKRTARQLGQRRAREQAERIGSEVILARSTAGLSRDAVGRRAGVSANTERRVEEGDPHVQITSMCAVTSAVGLDLVMRTYPSAQSTLRDAGQLTIARELCRMAHPAWHSVLEVPAGAHGEAIDLGLFGPREIIALEIERMLLDIQAQLRRAVVKAEELRRRHSRPVRLVLTLEDTKRNRAGVAQFSELIRASLPAGSRAVLSALRTGEPLGADGVLWVRRHRPPPPTRG